MEKKEIVFSELKNHLLSPGNIFWKKNSGNEVLISKKGDLCNLNLIEKIQSSKQKVLIEDEVDRAMLLHAKELFEAYEKEILVKNKFEWKNKIFNFLKENFIMGEKTQFEFNLIFWMVFSNLSFDEGASFIEKDRDCFIRSLSMGANITFLAMLFGYYDMNFLKDLFSKTVKDYSFLMEKKSGMAIKEYCETFKKNQIDANEMKEEFKLDEKSLFLYRVSETNPLPNEFSDIERLFIELNQTTSFEVMEEMNIMKKFNEHVLDIELRYYAQFEKVFGEDKAA